MTHMYTLYIRALAGNTTNTITGALRLHMQSFLSACARGMARTTHVASDDASDDVAAGRNVAADETHGEGWWKMMVDDCVYEKLSFTFICFLSFSLCHSHQSPTRIARNVADGQ